MGSVVGMDVQPNVLSYTLTGVVPYGYFDRTVPVYSNIYGSTLLGGKTISDFISSMNEKAPKSMTATQLDMKHNGDSVTLFCPPNCTQVTFSVMYVRKYWSHSRADFLGVVQKTGMSFGDARNCSKNAPWESGASLRGNSSQDTIILTKGMSKTYKVVEGDSIASCGYQNPSLDIGLDENLTVNLLSYTDASGHHDVAPAPDIPSGTEDVLARINKWLKDNTWTMVALGVIGIAGVVVYNKVSGSLKPKKSDK